MNSARAEGEAKGERHGVVAVCVREAKFLVIRRSQRVEAPGALCFPGGALEPGEEEPQALARELQEELHCESTIIRRVWRSRTDWDVHLGWWLATIDAAQIPAPNLAEVASIHWMTEYEMRQSPMLLTSNIAFLDAWRNGEFTLE